MKCFQYFTFLFILFFHCTLSQNKVLQQKPNTSNLGYIENKGQVCDQNHKTRSDVLFTATDGKMLCHLKKNGISYQLNKIDNKKEQDSSISIIGRQIKKKTNQITIYRLDVNWINANKIVFIKKGIANDEYDNYYLEQCPNGLLNVKNYKDITYQNIYNGIDLKWYYKDGHLKYDYLVSTGANYKQIQLEYKGAEKIVINKNGELIITTPLGNIIEQAPLVTQNGKTLKAKWLLKNNIVSYSITNLNPSQSFIIDPVVRTWGTYYGGNGDTYGASCATDINGNVFLSGSTDSNGGTSIATVGSYQTIFTGWRDAFLVKFDSLGVRQWGTYYGGSGLDQVISCATDFNGNVFCAGITGSNTGTEIATTNSHQVIHGGGGDAFLVKFDNSGIRQWGTYYGGTGNDYGYSCKTDAIGNVYLAGFSDSYTGTEIATIGSHQPSNIGGTHDAFLVKFDNSGIRQWGTYYGGTSFDYGFSCTVDNANNVYLAGYTETNTGTDIATLGSHQPNHGGFIPGMYNDAFLVKFNSNGVRQWGTYYGGTGDEIGYCCSTDLNGNVYLTGSTQSTVGISTTGSHQATFGSTSNLYADAFLVKFDSAGIRQWGSYYGGSGFDGSNWCGTDNSNNIYVSGTTVSTSGTVIASSGSHQPLYGGGYYDAFLTKFNPNGMRQWGTYYGGTGNDFGISSVIDNNRFYIAGQTESNSGTDIATIGSHQANIAGTANAYLVQFYDCNTSIPPINNTPLANQSICSNNTTTLSVLGIGTINWYSIATGGVSLGTGTTFVTPSLSVGTYSYYAEDNICNIIPSRTAITFTVNSTPIISVNSGSICSGNSFTIIPNGASTYTYSSGSSIVTPTITTNYTIIGSSIEGCIGASVISSITVNALPIITVNSGSICSGNSFTIVPSGANTYTYSSSSVITPSITSSYTVIGESANGCLNNNVAISTVTVIEVPSVSITGNTVICASELLTLIANGVGNFLWNTGETTPSITSYPTSNITYSISATNACGTASDLISVIVNSLPTINYSNDTTILSDNTINLFANGGITYNWQPANLGCNTCSVVTVSPTSNTTYTVMITAANGCTVTKMISVRVEDNFEIFIPDIFSPNGDGQNDILYVRGLGIKEMSFKLFNRIGEKIFETNDITKGWDGCYKGTALNNAVFVYVLTATRLDGSKINKHGDVTLIR
jgi:gliding motility-associated-like protein